MNADGGVGECQQGTGILLSLGGETEDVSGDVFKARQIRVTIRGACGSRFTWFTDIFLSAAIRIRG